MKKIIPYIWVVVVIAVFVLGGRYLDKKGTNIMPQQPAVTASDFKNYGLAPSWTNISNWLNSSPLKAEDLKGKVVLVDFWTYSCINCIRTLPYVTKWYDTYKDQGLVVVGVHTPEFAFEKDSSNVSRAIKQFNIHYPVAQDNDYGTWNVFNNQYWPAEYLIDKDGEIVYEHFGEGEYDHTENAIRTLLGLSATAAPDNGQDLSQVGSPEMYFGSNRLQYLASGQNPAQTNFTLPQNLDLNTFGLGGSWQISPETAKLTKPNGSIKLKFHSGKVFMVAQSDKPVTLQIKVDGKSQPPVTIQASQLYTLFDSSDYSDHVIEITIPDAGFEAFTFTFG